MYVHVHDCPSKRVYQGESGGRGSIHDAGKHTPQTTGGKRETRHVTVHAASERYATQADEKQRAAEAGGF